MVSVHSGGVLLTGLSSDIETAALTLLLMWGIGCKDPGLALIAVNKWTVKLTVMVGRAVSS